MRDIYPEGTVNMCQRIRIPAEFTGGKCFGEGSEKLVRWLAFWVSSSEVALTMTTTSRIAHPNAKLLYTFFKCPPYKIDDWVWVCNRDAITR